MPLALRLAWHRAAALTLLTLTVACSAQRTEDAGFHAWFDALRARTDRGDGSARAVRAGSLRALPIVHIGLKRSRAYDFTSLEIRFDGGDRATRRGGMSDWPNTKHTSYTAEVPFHEFARLCWLVESLDLPEASTSWSVQVSHGEERSVRWTTVEGRTVELSDYGGASPPAVDALAAAIENTARRLEWTAADDAGETAPR